MTILRANFRKLVDQAMSDPNRAGLRPVIEKELLHYDILFALERENLLKSLVFQGGTSLRLCHGSHSYSEDLDFVGGRDFSSGQLREIAGTVTHYLGDRYGLEIAIKAPREMRNAPGHQGFNVDRWQVSVVTSPDRPDLPRQRIKFEVANIPSHDAELLPLQRNYDFLPTGYEDILVRVETRREILADKLISFPVTLDSHVRHRDIWDMQWLRQGRAEIAPDLIRAKIADYRIENYEQALDQAIERASEVVHAAPFQDEMARFLPKDRLERTFERPGFLGFMASQLRDMLEDTLRALDLAREPAAPGSFSL